MDKDLRTSLRTVVAGCRQTLEEDVRRQLEGTYGVTPSGEFISSEDVEPYAVDVREWRREREEILAAIAHIESYGVDRVHAVEQFVRETAFTVLNQLAALKLMEHSSRALIPESVGRGKDSKGFALFQRISPEVCRAARNGPILDSGYRLYLESIFDDLAEDLGVLFDRSLPQSIIFPSEGSLTRVLNVLNQADIATVWFEDETIGWIYQYFTPKELRDEARKASQAPRNSYELAFRNQFYTPRYVVEFLVDNTLGRLWFEMGGGSTVLKDRCKCLEANSISERQRHKKDPRDVRVLDPACGSGHFLLYAFSLLEAIYLEAWNDLADVASEDTGRPLREDYPDRDSFLRAVPELILRHNLYGIDIDLRATQIAALALWLRAQRSYQDQGIRVPQRNRIKKANIVCAEPMPGERELLQEFSASLEPRLLRELTNSVFDKMRLADEAGSLLRIPDEIKGAIAEARKQWASGPEPEQLLLFPSLKSRTREQLTLFDVSDITDESFWEHAEKRVLDALERYARSATNGRAYQRRLFADDAAHGFALIDTCRQQFDVVLMNPPFGLPTKRTFSLLKEQYPDTYVDMYASFVTRAMEWAPGGLVGAITSRAFLTTKKLGRWRMKEVVPALQLLLDLGSGVMDEAFVEACACVFEPAASTSSFLACNRRDTAEKGWPVSSDGVLGASVLRVERERIRALPACKILYAIPDSIHTLLRDPNVFEPAVGTARQGMTTFGDFKFLRLRWEVDPKVISSGSIWEPLSKGGAFARFYSDIHLVVKWNKDGAELAAENKRVNGQVAQSRQASEYWRRPGCTYSKRSVKGFSVRALPSDCIFGTKGPAILSLSKVTPEYLVGWFNSRLIVLLVHIQANAHEFNTGILKELPWRPPAPDLERALEVSAVEAVVALRDAAALAETNTCFLAIPHGSDFGQAAAEWMRVQTHAGELESSTRARWDAEIDKLYGVDTTGLIEGAEETTEDDAEEDADDSEDESNVGGASGASAYARALVSYAFGCVVGRWDLRVCLQPNLRPRLSSPFAALPACPPGMLVGVNGFPTRSGEIVSEEWLHARRAAGNTPPDGSVTNATAADGEYPIRVDWDGIVVDDEGHPDDVVARVREVFEALWPGNSHAVEEQVCRQLDVAELRDYFRTPGGFFSDHLRVYSKSRRKAPIYWLLQSSRKSYGLWFYYHRLDRDTVFKALRTYVEPKITGEATRLKDLKERLREGGETLARRERSKLEKEIERQDDLLGELSTFKVSLERVSALGYEPDLDDGVVLNIAPFHDLSPWKEAKAYWKNLLDGGHEWSTIAKQLRAREVGSTPPGRSERHG